MPRAMTISYSDLVAKLPPDSTAILRNLIWEDYEDILNEVGESPGLRLTYSEGMLCVMTLSPRHEKYSRLIEKMIGLLSVRLGIRILSFGSATIKKPTAKKGAEADCCFYVGSASLIGVREEIDFDKDPPPDIIVEIDIHHESSTKCGIYARLECRRSGATTGRSSRYHFSEKGSIRLPARARPCRY